MNKKHGTKSKLVAYKPIKRQKGLNFAHIRYETSTVNEESKSMLDRKKTLESYSLRLRHWKEGEKYYTQWTIRGIGVEDSNLGEPYMSSVPLNEEDNDRDEYLIETLSSKFEHIDIKKVEEFFSDISNFMNEYDHLKLLLEEEQTEDEDSPTFRLISPTSHLRSFDDLLKATGLRGEEYVPIIKALWYNQLSVLIPKLVLKQGGIVTDGRIHLLIFLPSGGGKGEIKRTIKQVLDNIGKSYVEPTSFHPEQFMGKVRIDSKKGGEKEYVPVKGHLSVDFIIIDEGKELLTSKDPIYTESRKYLRLAIDPYPNNTVEKKPVDIEHKHALKYEPHCCICIFVQPFKVGENIVLDGDLRRFILSYIPIETGDKTEIYKARANEIIDYEGAVETFADFLNSIEIPDSFELTEEAVQTFTELSILIIDKGLHRSKKIKKFIEMADFSIQNLLLKFSAVQALQNNSGNIEPKHVELAFIDLAEIMEQVYNFIEEKVMGNLDYGDDLDIKDHTILKWLTEQKATAEATTTVSIKQYQEKIMEIYGVEKRQARRIKSRHEEMGWIESKLAGHDSKVWLAPTSREITEEVSRVRVDKDFQEKYNQIIKKHKLK